MLSLNIMSCCVVSSFRRLCGDAQRWPPTRTFTVTWTNVIKMEPSADHWITAIRRDPQTSSWEMIKRWRPLTGRGP